MMLAVAVVVLVALVLVGPHTRRRSWWRALFAVLVIAQDGLMLAEVVGPGGPRTAGGAVLAAGVLMLTLPGFVLWWGAVDRAEDLRQLPQFGSVVASLRVEGEPRAANQERLEPSEFQSTWWRLGR